MLRLMLVVFLLPLVCSVDVDLDCPEEVYVGEEFECDVEVEDGEAKYDLKVEVDEERDSVLRIFDEGDWKSGYYYLKGFVRDDEAVSLKILEKGKYDLVVKLRDGDWVSEFDCGRIKVLEGEDDGEGEEDNGTRIGDRISQMNADFVEDNGVIELGGDEVILLGGGEVVVEDEWDYVSKDGMIVDWLPYMFGVFMIFLIFVLGWDKLTNRY